MALIGRVIRPIMAGEMPEVNDGEIRTVTAGFTFRAKGMVGALRQAAQALKMARETMRFEEQMQQVAQAASMTPEQVRLILAQLRSRTENG